MSARTPQHEKESEAPAVEQITPSTQPSINVDPARIDLNNDDIPTTLASRFPLNTTHQALSENSGRMTWLSRSPLTQHFRKLVISCKNTLTGLSLWPSKQERIPLQRKKQPERSSFNVISARLPDAESIAPPPDNAVGGRGTHLSDRGKLMLMLNLDEFEDVRYPASVFNVFKPPGSQGNHTQTAQLPGMTNFDSYSCRPVEYPNHKRSYTYEDIYYAPVGFGYHHSHISGSMSDVSWTDSASRRGSHAERTEVSGCDNRRLEERQGHPLEGYGSNSGIGSGMTLPQLLQPAQAHTNHSASLPLRRSVATSLVIEEPRLQDDRYPDLRQSCVSVHAGRGMEGARERLSDITGSANDGYHYHNLPCTPPPPSSWPAAPNPNTSLLCPPAQTYDADHYLHPPSHSWPLRAHHHHSTQFECPSDSKTIPSTGPSFGSLVSMEATRASPRIRVWGEAILSHDDMQDTSRYGDKVGNVLHGHIEASGSVNGGETAMTVNGEGDQLEVIFEEGAEGAEGPLEVGLAI